MPPGTPTLREVPVTVDEGRQEGSSPGKDQPSREPGAATSPDMSQLTFTRFIAAMAVVVFHWAYFWPGLNDWMWQYRLHVGPTMVSYFYVLSGFIMTSVYLKPDGGLDRRRYWAARAARVYPVYLLGVALMAIPFGFGVEGTRLDPLALLLNLLLLQAWIPQYALSLNSPGWSLSVEAFFYLAFPWLLILMARTRSGRAMFVFTATVWLLTQVVYHWGYRRLLGHDPILSHELLHYHPLFHLNAFLIGMCAGIWVKRNGQYLQALGARHRFVPLSVLCLSAAVAIALMTRLNRASDPILLSTTNGLIAPLFAVFVAALSIDGSRLSSVLRLAPFVLLGEISYAIYILQIPVAWFLRSMFSGQWTVAPATLFVIYLVVLIAASFLVYRYYEKPLRAGLRRRLSGEERR
jgi:peptidoglycan/LPS O-acetylase OafA/YrhL